MYGLVVGRGFFAPKHMRIIACAVLLPASREFCTNDQKVMALGKQIHCAQCCKPPFEHLPCHVLNYVAAFQQNNLLCNAASIWQMLVSRTHHQYLISGSDG